MKKIILNKETIRNLDDDNLNRVQGGFKFTNNTTAGRRCAMLSTCTQAVCCRVLPN